MQVSVVKLGPGGGGPDRERQRDMTKIIQLINGRSSIQIQYESPCSFPTLQVVSQKETLIL